MNLKGMSIKEALDIMDDVTWQDNGRHYGRIDLARETLRQAAKKQEFLNPKCQQEQDGNNWYCPVCGHYLVDEEEFKLECLRPVYCEGCGQAIDWSEENVH